MDIFEMAADKGHHHVTHAKTRRRVPRFEKPFGHDRLLSSKDFTLTRLRPQAAFETYRFTAWRLLPDSATDKS